METIKTSALMLLAIAAYLLLPQGADDSGQETPPGTKTSASAQVTLGQQTTPCCFEHNHPVPAATAAAQPVKRNTPEMQAESSALPLVIDWPLLIPPHLAYIAELENLPADSALVELVPMLTDEDPLIRRAVIQSLGDMSTAGALQALTTALNDVDPQLQIDALEALASHDDVSVVSNIETYLYAPEQDLRIAAIEALADLGSETSVHALAGLLTDQDLLIRHHAVSALGEIGGENSMMYLMQALYDPSTKIQSTTRSIFSDRQIEEVP